MLVLTDSMEGKKFQRRIEDFDCEHCGAHVVGNGYTDHCPKCLWSKHVDINPGDRMASCGGMMRPMSLVGSSPNYRIVYRCEKCGAAKTVSAVQPDDEAVMIELAREAAK
jgi:ribosomal protein L37AE/L43A